MLSGRSQTQKMTYYVVHYDIVEKAEAIGTGNR